MRRVHLTRTALAAWLVTATVGPLPYRTGSGVGHNNTEAETGPAEPPTD